MNENRKFKCKMCNKLFSVDYQLSNNRVLQFCSTSCRSRFNNPGYHNKTQLENKIKKLIIKNDRYTTKDEVLRELKISSKTLSKFRVSILGLNRELKMKKPSSMFELMVGNYLETIFDDLVFQQTFEECVSPKGYPLKFDFYSAEYNILIEADGAQHGDEDHRFSSEYTFECDLLKDKFAKNNKITLIRIPYTRNVTKEYVSSFINIKA